MGDKTTGEVAIDNGTTEPRLQYLIRNGKIPRPLKMAGGKRVWTKRDQENARAAVENNPEER